MCGLIYSENFNGKPVNGYIMEQFEKQRHRGTEGFGLFNGEHLVKAAEEHRIKRWLRKEKNASSLVMFHHRNPTSTVNVRQAAHPFTTGKYFGDTEYILIHNGYITNDLEMFTEHQELGIEYQSFLKDLSFNDSEALLWDFALYMEGWQDQMYAEGVMALICMKLVKGKVEKLYFDRNTNPLYMERTKDGLSLSSEGDGDLTEEGMLYTWNYDLKRLTKRPLELKHYVYTPPVKKDHYDKNWEYSNGESYLPFGSVQSLHQQSLPVQQNLPYQSPAAGFNSGFRTTPVKKLSEFEPNPKTQVLELVDRVEGLHSPTWTEIENCALLYLTKANGKFDTAYWNINGDYMVLENEPLDEDVLQKMTLLEEASKYIEDDEEYIDKDSVSSFWRALWTKAVTA